MRAFAKLLLLVNILFVSFPEATSFTWFEDLDEDVIEPYITKLTLKHKIGQMMQLNIDQILTPDKSGLDREKLEALIREWSPGSLLNSPFSNGMVGDRSGWNAVEWKALIDEVQNLYMNTTLSSGVRMLFGIDSVHGAVYIENATIFPQQINIAATFNPEFAEQMGSITAKDTRMAGSWIEK
mmetsp:Transcript_28452/g.62296  ORF Transcript_28452/g.62296 Transcript_28452/m.62296 type:complete len:182 (+) Transcript_28452:189-734(+)